MNNLHGTEKKGARNNSVYCKKKRFNIFVTNYISLCFKYFLLLSERMFPLLTIKINVHVKQNKSKKISSSFFVLFWSPIDYFYCLFFEICWLIFNYFVNSLFEVFICNLVVCNWLFFKLRSCFYNIYYVLWIFPTALVSWGKTFFVAPYNYICTV